VTIQHTGSVSKARAVELRPSPVGREVAIRQSTERETRFGWGSRPFGERGEREADVQVIRRRTAGAYGGGNSDSECARQGVGCVAEAVDEDGGSTEHCQEAVIW
jgi:hypothetical protein